MMSACEDEIWELLFCFRYEEIRYTRLVANYMQG